MSPYMSRIYALSSGSFQTDVTAQGKAVTEVNTLNLAHGKAIAGHYSYGVQAVLYHITYINCYDHYYMIFIISF